MNVKTSETDFTACFGKKKKHKKKNEDKYDLNISKTITKEEEKN